jgi:hypothetical protein
MEWASRLPELVTPRKRRICSSKSPMSFSIGALALKTVIFNEAAEY